MKLFYPYRYGNTGVRLGVGVYDRPFYDLLGTPWFKDNTQTPAYAVDRSLNIAGGASDAFLSQTTFNATLLPGSLGVGDMFLTGLLVPQQSNSVGSP